MSKAAVCNKTAKRYYRYKPYTWNREGLVQLPFQKGKDGLLNQTHNLYKYIDVRYPEDKEGFFITSICREYKDTGKKYVLGLTPHEYNFIILTLRLRNYQKEKFICGSDSRKLTISPFFNAVGCFNGIKIEQEVYGNYDFFNGLQLPSKLRHMNLYWFEIKQLLQRYSRFEDFLENFKSGKFEPLDPEAMAAFDETKKKNIEITALWGKENHVL